MIYKNLSRATKTFYGVTFRPGDVHEVPGYINDPKFVKVFGVTLIPESAENVSSSDSVSEPTAKRTRTKTTKEEVITNGTDSDQ